MKIFVTGATGFIGKYLVNGLINSGHKITINLRKDKVSPFSNDVKIHYLETESIEKDILFFKQEAFDGIIHLASLYITAHKPQDVSSLIDSNVKFGLYVLECAAQAQVKWFINTGTFWQNYKNADYSPVNLYAASKQAFENIAKYYIETEQIKFATLRLSDTFGPNDTRPKVFNLWRKIAKTGEILDMSAGEQIIDISFIEDIVSAFSLLATHLQNKNPDILNGAIFAVRANKCYTLKDLAIIYQEATGTKLNINWGARPYRDREVMIPWNQGEIVPGWKANTDIKILIKLYLEYEN